jgi:hypothetical protein
MPEALPSVRSGVARSEGTSQSACPVQFTHSVAAGAERAASVLASVVAFFICPRRWNQGRILDGIRLLRRCLVELSMGHWAVNGHRGDGRPGSGAQRPP